MDGLLNNMGEVVLLYGVKIIAACVIFLIGKRLAKFFSEFTERLMERAKVEKTLSIFVRKLVYVSILVLIIIAALAQLGIQTASIIAVLGAASLAVGLALQNSLSNFAAGVLIVLFRPFKVGDLVEVGGVIGTVSDIHIFTTELYSLDNRKYIIPNSQITTGIITNFTAVDKRRVDLVFSISYNDDIKLAKDVLMDVLQTDERIMKDPAPVVAVGELADSSVNLICRPWVRPEHYWDVYFDLLEKGKLALEKSGITIPYPQTDVHLYRETQ